MFGVSYLMKGLMKLADFQIMCYMDYDHSFWLSSFFFLYLRSVDTTRGQGIIRVVVVSEPSFDVCR